MRPMESGARIELLEGRRLLSATIELLQTNGTYTASDGSIFKANNGVHVRASEATIAAYPPDEFRYDWDMGDDGSAYNELPGFNAAHVYDVTSTTNFTVTLRVSDANLDGSGVPVTHTDTIEFQVEPESWAQTIYVNPDVAEGGDPVAGFYYRQTLENAFDLLDDDTRVLLARGKTHLVGGANGPGGIGGFSNVLISAYGTGADPLLLSPGGTGGTLFNTTASTRNITIENLDYDVSGSVAGTRMRLADLAGRNVVIRNVDFDHVQSFLENGEADSDAVGVLVQDNRAHDNDSTYRYGVFARGTGWTILGNEFLDSKGEHNIRSYADYLNAHDNDLVNHLRADDSDTKSLNTLRSNDGSHIWWSNNRTYGGTLVAGVLTPVDGTDPDALIENLVVEGNELFAWGANGFEADHIGGHSRTVFSSGIHTLLFRNNIVWAPHQTAITVTPSYSGVFTKGPHQGEPVEWHSENIHIVNNTILNLNPDNLGTYNGGTVLTSRGKAFQVNGSRDDTYTYRNNIYVAPALTSGDYQTSGIYVNGDSDLSSFVAIDGNIWPDRDDSTTWGHGIHWINTEGTHTSDNYKDEAEYEAFPEVGDDLYLTLDESDFDANWKPLTTNVNIGDALPTVSRDHYQPVVEVVTWLTRLDRPVAGRGARGS